MKINDPAYNSSLLREDMTAASEVIRNFKPERAKPFAEAAASAKGLFLTGEGSSRLFPAKRAVSEAMRTGSRPAVFTEGATQALEYDLENYAVFGASNSGRTREVIRLARRLRDGGHPRLFGLTAGRGTPLEEVCRRTHVLGCGPEGAVAATKSVVEQALFYQALAALLRGEKLTGLDEAADDFEAVLGLGTDQEAVEKVAKADTVYFAGRNAGVAEELALKTNEIIRKKSGYLEGTYAVHGIEEVLGPNDVVVLVDPFEEEEAKIYECLVAGIGLSVFAVADRKTTFPTLLVPRNDRFGNYLQLAAGWSLLAETGILLGIDSDRPARARKIGNEFSG